MVNTLKLVIIIIVIIIACNVIKGCRDASKKLLNESFGFNCQNCNRNDWMGESDCYSCNNCGWCIDPNGNGSCGHGTINGPLFKDCRSWFYNGRCIWGPDCGYSGPIYYDNAVLNYPWYSRWWYWGLRRPWRRRFLYNKRLGPLRRYRRRLRRNLITRKGMGLRRGNKINFRGNKRRGIGRGKGGRRSRR